MSGATHAIPTTWNGIQFRSRLEARWASFFTKLGWEWSYEPIDLKGYIPDFMLHMHKDVLVEVKPFTRLDDDCIGAAHEKIEESGWYGDPHPEHGICLWKDAIVVGARIFDADQSLCLGQMNFGDQALLGVCVLCGQFSVSSDSQSYACRACGDNDGNPMSFYGQIERRKQAFGYWNEAGNEVQWLGGRRRA